MFIKQIQTYHFVTETILSRFEIFDVPEWVCFSEGRSGPLVKLFQKVLWELLLLLLLTCLNLIQDRNLVEIAVEKFRTRAPFKFSSWNKINNMNIAENNDFLFGTMIQRRKIVYLN